MSDPRPLLVTAALPYANGPLHFGHIAGAYLPADIFTRWHRLAGSDVLYICGTDEHGVAITLNAEKAGQDYQAYVDHWHAEIKALFDRFGIAFDHFSRTTNKEPHYPLSQEFFLRLLRAGRLVKRDVQQLYSSKTRRFLADRYVRGKCYVCGHEPARGDECPKCGTWLDATKLLNPVAAQDPSDHLELRPAWQFELDLAPLSEGEAATRAAYGEAMVQYLAAMRETSKPNVRTMMFDKLIEGEKLRGRPITRDLPWGVPLPEQDLDGKPLGDVAEKVLYVWFDAPIGYVSATIEWARDLRKQPELWRRYWIVRPGHEQQAPRLMHFIGKDNIPFHTIVFPAMLAGQTMAPSKPGDRLPDGRPLIGPREGERWVLPDAVPANEFYNLEGKKFSTSENWMLDIPRMFEVFGVDALRWYIASSMPETSDSQFTFAGLQATVNAELCDTLGNYAARTLKFNAQHLGGRVPDGVMAPATKARIEQAFREVGEAIAHCEFRRATQAVAEFGRWGNKLFDEHAPWKTRKTDLAACGRQVHEHVQCVAALAVLLAPFVPDASKRLRKMLALPEATNWVFGPLPVGHALGEPGILFAKIPDEVVERERAALGAKAG
jgi:methionyl-tRNA synthetase